ncbi:glutathione S-transferase family protein [Roseibium marinum]|uniref:Glutathione S-transferase n=1 Tax=Roseibium marinum TaxID=281252 RepID=A0A2S3UWU9_9HYPH|nr:glutathione S-transferase N-terminal domain-containing protein [Roseibium marinum]POF32177.1 glutathione S-transferase [Roseibium marinum]
MMKLHWSPRSPFVRKVMIALHETGLLDEVECIRSVVAVHLPPNEQVMPDNPLGKIPVLVTDEGKSVFDSRVICEYLDMKSGTGLFPVDPVARLDQLRWQALADGLTDILLIWRTELSRESGPWQAVTEGWLIKARAAMARLEKEAPALEAADFGIGHIALICALGQLDFRWSDCRWRDHFPALSELEARMAKRPSVVATAVVDDQDSGAGDLIRGNLAF